MLSGTLGPTEITEARMNGTEINFSVGNTRYTGTLDGKTMSGTISGSNAKWAATMK